MCSVLQVMSACWVWYYSGLQVGDEWLAWSMRNGYEIEMLYSHAMLKDNDAWKRERRRMQTTATSDTETTPLFGSLMVGGQ